jgi:hypothetical protein
MLRGRPFARRHGGVAAGAIAPDQLTTATKRFWHDAQDVAATTAGSCVDKYSNGYDFTQATPGKQPTLVTDAFGGRRSMRFTAASSQELIFTHATKIDDFAGGTDKAYEWWFVFQPAVASGNRTLGCADSTTSAATYELTGHGAAWYYERRDGVGATTFRTQNGALPVVNTPYVLRARYTGTDCAWTVNGTTLTTSGSNDTGAMALDRLIYGSYGSGAGAHSLFLDGWILESVGLTGTLSDNEARGLTNYLKNKSGIVF